MIIQDIIYIALVLLIGYNYIFYPIILFVFSKIINRKVNLKEIEPEITFVISAHNEEELIEGAINSILNSNYPKNKIKIIIGSDGSTDKTNEILKNIRAVQPNILNYYIYNRLGKNKVLNELVDKVRTDIIFFMDADCRISENSIKEIIKNFSDESVGGVIASQKIESKNTEDNSGKIGDNLYHKYEEFIRIAESRIHSNVNSLGYLYAVRKNLLSKIPNDNVCDDLFNIYTILSNNKRVIFEKNAKAKEIRSKSLQNESHRRVRAVAGGIATVMYFKKLFNIFKYGWISFFIFSHKVFRWLSPFFIVFLVLFTIIFWRQGKLWDYIFYIQLIFYLMVLIGWISEKKGVNLKISKIFLFFISMNYSSIMGTIRYLKGQQNAIWDRIGFNE